MKYNINVLPFFDEMLDRSDMTIKVTGGCDGAVGARDAELSKAMGEPMSHHERRVQGTCPERSRRTEVHRLDAGRSGEPHRHLCQGVGYDWSTQMTPVAGSTFDKVFVSLYRPG